MGAPCCTIGARPDAADIDAGLRRLGEPGAESLNSLASRLSIAKSSLSRHRTGCLQLAAAGPGTGPSSVPPFQEQHGDSAEHSSGTAKRRSPAMLVPNPGDDALTAPRKVVTAQLEARAVDLRAAGKPYTEIAAELGVAEATAVDLVERALIRIRKGTDSRADKARALDLVRIERMIAAIWGRATGAASADEDGGYDPSQDKAVERVTKLLERRAKMLGLDAPTKVENIVQMPPVREFLDRVTAALQAARSASSADEAVDHVLAAMIRGLPENRHAIDVHGEEVVSPEGSKAARTVVGPAPEEAKPCA